MFDLTGMIPEIVPFKDVKYTFSIYTNVDNETIS
jgi:hypothetical protein